MASPLAPSTIKDAIPSASGSFCEKFLRALEIPRLFYEWYSYAYLENGEFTDDFVADICAVKCECSGATTPPPPPDGTTTLAKPNSVSATDGTELLKVVVTWAPVAGADTYEIWRAANNNDFSIASRIGTTTTITYDDSNVVQGIVYWYWIRAKNAVSMQFSPYSDPDSGFAQPNLVNGNVTFTQPGSYVFIVPAGVTALTFIGAGAGGGGGGAAIYIQPGLVSSLNSGGGGGGGGGYKTTGGIVVTPGETLQVLVGAGGGAGISRLSNRTQQPAQGATGGNGGSTGLLRAGVVLDSAPAGHGGQGGYVPSPLPDSIIDGGGGSGGGGTSAGTDGEAGQHSGNGFQAIGGAGGFPTSGAAIGPFGIGGQGAGSVNGAVSTSRAGTGGLVKLTW